jgi:hypothetical protein
MERTVEMFGVGVLVRVESWYPSREFGAVFVGAFSDFGGLVYGIPAPIFGLNVEKPSTPHE